MQQQFRVLNAVTHAQHAFLSCPPGDAESKVVALNNDDDVASLARCLIRINTINHVPPSACHSSTLRATDLVFCGRTTLWVCLRRACKRAQVDRRWQRSTRGWVDGSSTTVQSQARGAVSQSSASARRVAITLSALVYRWESGPPFGKKKAK